MPKIIDVITFNGEADVLNIRLDVLRDYVDQFVIIEFSRTFSGISKTPYFPIHKERFKDYNIKYYLYDESIYEKYLKLAHSSPNTNGAFHWKVEFAMKECIKDALIGLDDEDIVFISDCDEIWDPNSLQGLVWDMQAENIWRIKQKVYCYYLNMRSNEEWAGTLLLKYKSLKNRILNHLRGGLESNHPRMGDGWHFTNQGGIEEVRRKLNDSYTEESYNKQHVRDLLEARFGRGDWLDRQFNYWIDDSEWPEYLKINREKYDRFLKKV